MKRSICLMIFLADVYLSFLVRVYTTTCYISLDQNKQLIHGMLQLGIRSLCEGIVSFMNSMNRIKNAPIAPF